eukprot:TRINITY_DN47530_c0_g1_i1.p1 TRINITY_DN47530_c0_g1~~TRINITY_DN47530_c0_g1_i1.p1  ORF type:complete len:440 (+),score=76.26 TRINITY_DN47530_c0_g1_i1:147-1466(+)
MLLQRRLEQLVREDLREDPVHLYKQIAEAPESLADPSASDGALASQCSIFHYNALTVARRTHTEDLWSQLHSLAEENSHLFNDDTQLSSQSKAEALYKALQEAEITDRKGKAEEASALWQQVCYEFLGEQVMRVGPLLMPTAAERQSEYCTAMVVAVLVASIQMLAPLCLLSTRIDVLHQRLSGTFCVGGPLNVLETMCKAALLLLFVFALRQRIESEARSLERLCRMPCDAWWTCLGTTAKLLSHMSSGLAFPLVLLHEDTLADALLVAGGIFCVLALDDLAWYPGFFRCSTNHFWKAAWRSCALLERCPINLHDLTDLDAKDLKEFWKVDFDSSWRLLLCADKRTRCPTRIDLSLRLANDHHEQVQRQASTEYWVTPTQSVSLPMHPFMVLQDAGLIVGRCIAVLQVVLPLVFLLCAAKQCGGNEVAASGPQVAVVP